MNTNLLAAPALLLVIAALWPVALFVVLAAAVAWLWETRRRARAQVKRVTRERDVAVIEAALASELLNQYKSDALVIPFPTQRTGAHDDLAALDAEATAYTWPAIARDAFPIQQWGEDAER